MRRLIWPLALLMVFAMGCGSKQPEVDTTDTGEDPGGLPPLEEPEDVTDTGTEGEGFGVGDIEEEPGAADIYLDDVFFAFDEYDLTEESKKVLADNADELRRATKVRIIIEGHCDERGTIAYNLALGEKRAQAAKKYLISFGIDSSRIEIVSYGKERPFSIGQSEEAWAKNRRAHFVKKDE